MLRSLFFYCPWDLIYLSHTAIFCLCLYWCSHSLDIHRLHLTFLFPLIAGYHQLHALKYHLLPVFLVYLGICRLAPTFFRSPDWIILFFSKSFNSLHCSEERPGPWTRQVSFDIYIGWSTFLFLCVPILPLIFK